jgi:hypothetical protein
MPGGVEVITAELGDAPELAATSRRATCVLSGVASRALAGTAIRHAWLLVAAPTHRPGECPVRSPMPHPITPP